MQKDIKRNNAVKADAPASGRQCPVDEEIAVNGEIAAAIAAALALHAGNNVHDRESYVITIRRKRRGGDVCYLD